MKIKELGPQYLENSIELGYRHSAPTGQLNPLFHTFAYVVNRVEKRQNTDWFMSNFYFSPTGLGGGAAWRPLGWFTMRGLD